MSEEYGAIRLLMDLRRQGISDRDVLSAIEKTPRDAFVDRAFADYAHEDRALPIACGQTISQPFVVAAMTQALEPGSRLKVLEIGTGSGYQAAVLARLFRRVYTIERHRDLLLAAQGRLERLDLHNVSTRLGDGAKGWPEQAPFDRILVTAAADKVPEALTDQLRPGGIMVAPVGRDPEDQVLLRLRKTDAGVEEERLMPVRFVPLVDGIARG